MNHTQPIVSDLESLRVATPHSTYARPEETMGMGHTVATHEVHAHAAACIADLYGFHQMLGDIQPIPTILSNTQDMHMDSILSSAEIAGNPTNLVDTAMTRLDTINNGYRQTLSTFIMVINGITRVCRPN